MQKLIECVPNFSQGRDLDLIRQTQRRDYQRSSDRGFMIR